MELAGSLAWVRCMMRSQEVAVEIGICVREVDDTMRHSWIVLRAPVQLGKFTKSSSGDVQRDG
jgi:hypothetical protein